jgi:hypothetical protein
MTKKSFEEIDPSELKIEFAPGCFDNFDGTQEELDEFIAAITEMFRNGEAQKMARPISELDEEELEMINEVGKLSQGRTLQ